MSSFAINFSNIDSDVNRLNDRLDSFRVQGKFSLASWVLDLYCWCSALRIESMSKDLQGSFSTLRSLKDKIERDDAPLEAIDKDFLLSDQILHLENKVESVASKLHKFRAKVPTRSVRTISSINRSLSIFSQTCKFTSSIRWEIGTHDAAFLGRADNLSGESSAEIRHILEKINAET
jgi:hypothetical protein